MIKTLDDCVTAALSALPQSARERFAQDPAYLEWREALPVVVVDDEPFLCIQGDRLATDEEALLEWIGLFHPEALIAPAGAPGGAGTPDELQDPWSSD